MDYGRRKGDNGFRSSENNEYYRRGRSPSPRGHYRHEDQRRKDSGYPPRDGVYGDGGYSRSGGSREYDRKPRSPERYSSSRRRDSSERSPRGRSRSPRSKRGHYYRSKSRSRSSSRGRERYRGRRSSSYGSRKRFRRGSSSSSSSSSGGDRSRSKNDVKKQEPKEDFYQSMYYKSEGENLQAGSYLHPALNKSTGEMQTDKSHHAQALQTSENVTAHAVLNTANFAALSQAYSASPPKKSYIQEQIDDEDRFLYGDDNSGAQEENPNHNPPSAPPPSFPSQEAPPKPVEAQKNVTPGGFDSNALKNVLKAIGFDFEMSAQQSQVANKPPPQEAAKPVPPPQPKLTPPFAEAPQQIQAIHGAAPPPPVQAPPPPAVPAQQYYQPYNPYNQTSPVSYPPQPVQTPVQDQSTGLQYPITVQDPSNPAGSLLVYQPVNPNTHQQMVYQQPSAPANMPVAPPQSGGRVVLPPHREEIVVPQAKKSEKEERQERLNYLQAELEKLKKQQNELLRKKRREKDGHKDPLIKKNNLLQAGVEEQIREIRQAAERAAGIASDSSDNEQKGQEEEKYDFFDPGNHWCHLCDTASEDLRAYLSHLHSKAHRKAVDPYDRPWDEGEQTNKKKAPDCESKALKGSEFLIPITGYYCKLCQTFSGDQICAEDHCKSYTHNTMYKKYCKKNPSYEKRMKIAENGRTDVKQEQTKVEVKFVDKSIKDVKEEYAQEASYVDKPVPPPNYIQPEVKYVPVVLSYPEKESQETEKRREKRAQEKHHDKEQDSRRESGHEKSEKSTHRDEGQRPPNKYEGDYEDSRDRGRQRKHSSPGFDEYEKQHENKRDKRRSREKHERRSRSRDRGEKWVERSPQDSRRKRDRSKDGVPVGAKVLTPGFGKFSWNSGMRSRAGRFDQVPVDTLITSREDGYDDKNGEFSAKGKIAIKITGKTHYPPRLSSSSALSPKSSQSTADSAPQEKKATTELQKKVGAFKRENALRTQLSSITLPSGRSSKQVQPKPNTAAVMLGTRSIGKHNTLLHSKTQSKKEAAGKSNINKEEVITHEVEADVSPPLPEDLDQPPPPGEYEPPPPGEEDIAVGDADDGANSDASGISMELASDED